MKLPYAIVLCFLLPILLCGQTRVDTTVVMSDGVKLDAVYYYPVTAPPASGYPAVLVIHGFGGSKDANGALSWARSGCLGVAYSVRGQGNSEGNFDFFSSPRIRADLQQMINYTKGMRSVNASRVGVTGASQGGIHSWMAAAYNMGVRAVAPVIANGRFEEDFANNNAINYIFSMALQYSNVRYTSWVKDTVIPALQNDNFSFLRSNLEQYSTKNLETNVTTPTFIFVSYFDQFFDPRAALEQFARIAGPKKILVYPGAHGTPTDAGHALLAGALLNRWFAYWLKDETAGDQILAPDSAVILLDQVTKGGKYYSVADSAYWLHPSASSPKLRLYFSGNKLSITAPAAAGTATVPYVSGLGSTNAIFRSDPAPADIVLSGAAGSADIFANSPADKYQVNLMLYDIDPATNTVLSMTRGHSMTRGNAPGQREEHRFTLNSIYHTLKAGHLIEARVGGGIPVLPGNDDFGNVVVAPNVTAVDTLFTGGATPSFFELNILPPVAAVDRAPNAPAQIALENYPNPFGAGTGSGTMFRYSVRSGYTHLELFDNLGRKVATLVESDLPEGSYAIPFMPGSLPGGVYHAVLTNGGAAARKEILYLR